MQLPVAASTRMRDLFCLLNIFQRRSVATSTFYGNLCARDEKRESEKGLREGLSRLATKIPTFDKPVDRGTTFYEVHVEDRGLCA